MKINFRDYERLNELGYASHLRIIQVANTGKYYGAILTVNVNGEPLEFTYNYIEINYPALWRGIDIRQYAIRRLSASILKKCTIMPYLLLCLNMETYQRLFLSDIQLSVPVCTIMDVIDEESEKEVVARKIDWHNYVKWIPEKPSERSQAGVLYDELLRKGLVSEVFERAFLGLKEIYPDVTDN